MRKVNADVKNKDFAPVYLIFGDESYLRENKTEIRTESSLQATYDATVSGFTVRLTKTVNDARVIDLTFPVPTKDAAENICINWKSHSNEALESLYESLIR